MFGAHGRCWQPPGSQGLGRSEGESLAGKNRECAELDKGCENTLVDFEAASDWPSGRSFSDVRTTRSQAQLKLAGGPKINVLSSN